ncbi:hypothetical protein [Lentzea sp. NPDC055074]
MDDPVSVLEFASLVGAEISWDPDRTDFLHDRLNRDARATAGIELSKRQYNRRFRMLRRLAAKADRLDRMIVTRDVTLLAAAGFVDAIDRDRFRADVDAACFIAYYTARRKKRREFTLQGRDNAFDEVAAALFRRCRLASGTDWAMIALAHPTEEVLGHLTPAELGDLIGRWSAATRAAATVLGDLWHENDFDQANMVVRRGHDSSTWNTFARAYNAARAGWIACLDAAGAVDLLAGAWPGKAMRLMAADLAWWHRNSGGDLHSDTDVWAALPLPWDVLDGSATCTRADVEHACRRLEMDPARSGWSAPPARGAVARSRPTPELVHGVAVADPVWGMALRRAGVYSGKAPVFGGQDAVG